MAENGKTTKIAPAGEFFAEGIVIEPVRSESASERLQLLRWDGTKSETGFELRHGETTYVPAPIDPTLLRAMMLPARTSSPEPVRQIATDLSSVIFKYTGLAENFAIASCRFAMSTWVIRSLPIAPWLAVVGPNTKSSAQLRLLLRCICRHAVALTDVTVSAMCSLPRNWNFTLLINDPDMGPRVQRFLHPAHSRNNNILRRGRLHQLFAPVATFTQEYPNFDESVTNLEIPSTPTRVTFSSLDDISAKLISDEFQARLLGYSLDNAVKVMNSTPNTAGLNYSYTELARTLAATTPDDADLQEDIIRIMEAQHAAMRPIRWGSQNATIIESILFFCREGQKDRVYVREITEIAQMILTRRGEIVDLSERSVGNKLRALGFLTEPRDRRVFSLVLSAAVRRRAKELGRMFDVPMLQNFGVAHDQPSARTAGATGTVSEVADPT